MKKKKQRYENGLMSVYNKIPTENIKFEKFIDLIYESKMDKNQSKQEIIMYVKAMETNYMDSINQ